MYRSKAYHAMPKNQLMKEPCTIEYMYVTTLAKLTFFAIVTCCN